MNGEQAAVRLLQALSEVDGVRVLNEVKLPDVQALVGQVDSERLDVLRNYLKNNRQFLSKHSSFDDFIDEYVSHETEAKELGTPEAARDFKPYNSAMTLIGRASEELRRVLWAHEVYLSASVVERLAFDFAAYEGDKDLVQSFFSYVIDRGLHRPGFVLFPIHGFGVLGAGVSMLLGRSRSGIDLNAAGIMITAQTNSQKETIKFLDEVRDAFGVSAPIPSDFSVEFLRKVTSWLTRNPLMAVRITSVTSDYYQNQLIIVVKLRAAAAIVLMLAALTQEGPDDAGRKNFSTAIGNNFETLDIKHYMIFEGWTDELEMLRVPMNLGRTELTALSDMSVEIDPTIWSRADHAGKLEAINSGVHAVERAYIDHWILGDRRSVRAKLMRKLFLSMGYFQRSFRGALHEDEAVVALAIAFETLLTDGYGRGGTKARIARRVRLCVGQVVDADRLAPAVDRLMEHRGQVVHDGASAVEVDFEWSRKAYVHCFLRIAGSLDELAETSDRPIGELLNDLPPNQSRFSRALAFVQDRWRRLRAKLRV